jgi:hypothetical protein
VSNLYFIEKMVIERIREVQRQADFRTRIGLRRCRAGPALHFFRQQVEGWLTRAGLCPQGANPDLEAVMGQIMAKPAAGAACHGGGNDRTLDSR